MSVNQIVEILMLKSRENEEVAKRAKEGEFYNASISRFYYSMYQAMVSYISIYEPGFMESMSSNDKKKEVFDNETGNDSHKKTGAKFIELVMASKMLTTTEKASINLFTKLRKIRNKADYDTIFYGKDNFFSNFYEDYNRFNSVLKKVLSVHNIKK